MTYIAGWKDAANNAYLCADSVSTTARRSGPVEARTTFGELHVDHPSKQVVEDTLKIVNLGSIAIAIAGDLRMGHAIVELVADLLKGGYEARRAFTGACLTQSPIPPDRNVRLLAVFPESFGGVLLGFNMEGRPNEVGELLVAHVGSIPGERKLETGGAIQKIIGLGLSPERNLVCALGLFQSMGIREYLLDEYSVGGTFCGLYATNQAIHWQSDILYVVLPTADVDIASLQSVSVMVRDHALVVRSSYTNDYRVFGAAIAGLDEHWLDKWRSTIHAEGMLRPYDYVVIINAQWANVTVIELLGRAASQDVRLRPGTIEEQRVGNSLVLTYSAQVRARLAIPRREPGTDGYPLLNFFDYRPPL